MRITLPDFWKWTTVHVVRCGVGVQGTGVGIWGGTAVWYEGGWSASWDRALSTHLNLGGPSGVCRSLKAPDPPRPGQNMNFQKSSRDTCIQHTLKSKYLGERLAWVPQTRLTGACWDSQGSTLVRRVEEDLNSNTQELNKGTLPFGPNLHLGRPID